MITLAALASAVSGAVAAAISPCLSVGLRTEAQDYDSTLGNLDDASAGSLSAAGVHGGHHVIQEPIITRGSHAALASAICFGLGATDPILAIGSADREVAVSLLTTMCLGLLAVVGARTSGTSIWRGSTRLRMLGSMALTLTTAAGRGFRLPT
ncbi:VIT1/CCC1 transporter family protein [Bosea sp. (in: a-proteobacteria)]|uniref:VIT1/CCC1 transporter family protein n=1 Tax=Bosea sp. (in: a-proteobacteria) TaxID=1871050 RepID=UPI0011FF18DD|nr:VIT1/CCC1 transporter family protein [Bosea sp. (in: a-proteobacteria)]TAJ34112.1 MAG: hypothetical protein EPO59_02960 [Bosea sp. (in: a-proteobacteria)]